MARILTLCIALLFTLLTFGQNVIDASTAAVVAYWKTGDQKTYKLTKTKTGEKEGRSTAMIDVKVLAATDTSYTVECKYRDMQYIGKLPDDPKAAKAAKSVLNAVDGMRVVVTTTETGSLVEVVNIKEIHDHSMKLLKMIADIGETAEERTMLNDMFSKLLTPELLQISASEDIGMILYPFGVEYKLNKKETGETALPNPFGGEPIPAVVSLSMISLNATSEKATVQMDQQLDPKGLESSLANMMSTLGTELDANAREEMKKLFLSMKVTDSATFYIDLKGAWVTKATFKRSIKVAGADQLEERTYQML